MQSVSIDGTNELLTQDATPTPVILFEATPMSSIEARLLILARRPSDGASKAWDITALMRMGAAGTSPVNLAAVGGNAPIGAAADLTALTGVTISFFAQGPNIGATLTGLAGTDIEWGLMLRGIQVID